jgi:hypothetical protein
VAEEHVKPQIVPTVVGSANIVVPTTGTTIAPTTARPSANFYDSYDGVKFFLAGVLALVVVIGVILQSLKSISDFLDRRKAKRQEEDTPLMNRIKDLEDLSKNFRGADHLDREFNALREKIDHERGNRQGSQQALELRLTDGTKKLDEHIRSTDARVNEERQARIRLESKVEGIASHSTRIESALDRLNERFDERFDRLQEIILNSKKPTS